MWESAAADDESQDAVRYEIRLQGHLEDRWAPWFAGMTITREGSGETRLSGVVDQAALHGLLRTVRDMGMPLLLVMRIESGSTSGIEPHQSSSSEAGNHPAISPQGDTQS